MLARRVEKHCKCSRHSGFDPVWDLAKRLRAYQRFELEDTKSRSRSWSFALDLVSSLLTRFMPRRKANDFL
jgi:hypothetical protein